MFLSYLRLIRTLPALKSTGWFLGLQKVAYFSYGQCLCFSGGSRALRSTVNAIPDANSLPDCKRRLENIMSKLETSLSKASLGYKQLVVVAKDLEMTSMQPGFWDDQAQAQSVLTALNSKKSLISKIDDWF
eukprot:gene32857-39729_t